MNPPHANKINIDELYERDRAQAIHMVDSFNKILARVHARIRTVSNQHTDTCCWCTIPNIIMGNRRYNINDCTKYVIDALRTNGFQVQAYPPNLLLVNWGHWVPSYVRTEVKRRTGVVLDEYGKVLSAPKLEGQDAMDAAAANAAPRLPETVFRSISTYKPTGRLGGGGADVTDGQNHSSYQNP
jgi:hypothetical protein